MRITNYRKALFLLTALGAIILGLYLESKFPNNDININKIDFNNAAVIGLTRGELICSENALITFIYPNSTNKVSLKNICEQLDVSKLSQENLQTLQ